MKNLLLFSFFLTLPLFAAAQDEEAPALGHNGKRTMWTYNFDFNPSLAGPNSKYKSMRMEEHYRWGMSRDITAMNHMHTLSWERALLKRGSAGGGVVIYRTKAVLHKQVNVLTDSGYVSVQPHGEWDEYSKAKIPVGGLNGYWKRFWKNSSAPYGTYDKYEVFARAYQTIYNLEDFISRDSLVSANVGKGRNMNYGMGIAYSFGKQFMIVKDKVALDYGLRLAYFFGTMKRTGRMGDSDKFDPLSDKEYIKSVSVERLFRFEAVNFRIGMSFLK